MILHIIIYIPISAGVIFCSKLIKYGKKYLFSSQVPEM